jgi:GTPase SAR1 family protein
VSLADVMEELQLGPNGGLVYCLEYLLSNLDWLEEQLHDFDDDYLMIDCPGQIELYTHYPIMKDLVHALERIGYRLCIVYLLDSQFMEDTSKFFSGALTAMSAMVQLELPHINVFSKMDLVERADSPQVEARVERFLSVDPSLFLEKQESRPNLQFSRLNASLMTLFTEYSVMSFLPLNIKEEDSIDYILSSIEHAMQFGEDLEPFEAKDGGHGDDD